MINKIVSKRSTEGERMTSQEVVDFMSEQGISDKEMSEIFGVSIQAVRLWVVGAREFTVTNSRLVRLFKKYPQLLREF